MRALEISVFVLLLSLGMSIAGNLFPGTGVSGGGELPVTSNDVTSAGSLYGQSTGYMGRVLNMFNMLKNAVTLFMRIIWGAVMLGDTVAGMVAPYSPPSLMVYALNGIGVVAASIALIQFTTGRFLRGGE